MMPALAVFALQGSTIQVSTLEELRLAAAIAKPGTTISLAKGDYKGGVFVENVHGTAAKPIVILGNGATISGGGTALHLSKVSYIRVQKLRVRNCTANGINIDDGGAIGAPSHHIEIRDVHVSDLPRGNHDGIKLSGVDDFRVEGCTIERWGGSAIDMVGCHRVVVKNCLFREGGDNGVQTKGGSSDVQILKCRFLSAGQRGVNIGGSTGHAFFRPSLAAMGAAKYEAKNIAVEGCTFVRGGAPIAFVGVDGARVRYNTLFEPGPWALRILQETTEPGFVPSRNGVFEANLIVFLSSNWASGGVNVGPNAKPESFSFARNYWFCSDAPSRSRPSLPTPEMGGTYGVDPKLTVSADGQATVAPGNPAENVGAHAFRER